MEFEKRYNHLKSPEEAEHLVKEIPSNNEVEEVFDKVESMPNEQRQILFEKMEIYQGDLPHPDILEGYNRLYPDAAQKIINNGINESEHRREMEKKYLDGQISDRKLGQWLGFIVAMVVIIGGICLIIEDHQLTGTILSGVSVIGLIGAFNKNANAADGTDSKEE